MTSVTPAPAYRLLVAMLTALAVLAGLAGVGGCTDAAPPGAPDRQSVTTGQQPSTSSRTPGGDEGADDEPG